LSLTSRLKPSINVAFDGYPRDSIRIGEAPKTVILYAVPEFFQTTNENYEY